MTCRFELEFNGKPYPRSCPTCGFAGKCVKGYEQIRKDGGGYYLEFKAPPEPAANVTKVISLVPKPRGAPDAGMISLLEHVLERAKAGEVRALAIATVGDDAASAWEGVQGDPALAVSLGGAVMALSHRYAAMLASE